MPSESIERTERSIVRGMAAIRFAQFAPFAPVALTAGEDAYRRPTLVVGLYVVGVLWSVGLFAVGLRRRGFTPGWVIADVALIAAIAVLVGEACLPGRSTTWDNWTVGPAFGAGCLAAVYGGRWLAATGVVVLASAYVTGTWRDLNEVGGLPAITGNTVSMVAFVTAAGMLTGWLRASAVKTDALAQAAMDAQREKAAMRARMEERARQYGVLHDTVLSTLSAIGRGGLDHRTVEIQERCAKEAAYLRSLITSGADEVPSTLGAALSAVVRDQAALDLVVHPQFNRLPADIPGDVVGTIASAAREALNNVIKHAGTNHAWLTARGRDDGSVAVTVADQGVGMDGDGGAGSGLGRSINRRLHDAGASATVQSFPGEGTTVEIQWPG